jgi:hypothetical protein
MDARVNSSALATASSSVSAKPKRRRIAVKPQLLCRQNLDGRTNAAKFFDRLASAIAADLGGRDQLSTIERSLIEAFCGAAVVLNDLNTRLALCERIDLGEHAQCVNCLVKLATRLGLQRRARDVTPAPTLTQYLQQRRHSTSEAAE